MTSARSRRRKRPSAVPKQRRSAVKKISKRSHVKEDSVSDQPIAVFDSGLGGLSVVRHLQNLLPHENIVYFGDTARVPYGSKSSRTVQSFALDVARYLMRFDPKLFVVACNTASALAIDALRAELPTHVVDVVAPGAGAVVATGNGGPVAVIGTEATIASNAYPHAIHALKPDLEVLALACPLLVPLVEEGRGADDPIVHLTIETYLAHLRGRHVCSLVLGCTHYPLLRGAIEKVLGPQTAIVDSGEATSHEVRRVLEAEGLLNGARGPGSMRCYVSDNPKRFRTVGSRFLGHALEQVEFVEPEEYVSQSLHDA